MRGFAVWLGLAVALGAVDASAHITLDEPPVRDSEMKDGPCGRLGSERTTDPARIKSFTTGEVVTVRWHETVPHTGYFRVAISMDGVTFPPDPDTTRPDEVFPILAVLEKDPDRTEYEVDVTLPDVACDSCTIQVIQYMEQHPGPPWYYQCADIVIEDGDGGGSGGGTSGSGGAAPGSGGASSGSGGVSNPGSGGAGGSANAPSAGSGGVPGGNLGGGPAIGGGGSSGIGGGAAGTGGSAGGNASAEPIEAGCSLAPRAPGSAAAFAVVLAAASCLLRRRRALASG